MAETNAPAPTEVDLMATERHQPLVDLFDIFGPSARGKVLIGLHLCEAQHDRDARISREDIRTELVSLVGDAPAYDTVREHLAELAEDGFVQADTDTEPYDYRLTEHGCDEVERCFKYVLEVNQRARPCINQ